jgi:hypothetical protein
VAGVYARTSRYSPRRGLVLIYKVIETSTVTEDILEKILNTWVPQGWHFDGIQFVVRDASKRPSMAFLFFVREVREGQQSSSDEPESG